MDDRGRVREVVMNGWMFELEEDQKGNEKRGYWQGNDMKGGRKVHRKTHRKYKKKCGIYLEERRTTLKR